MNLDHEFPKRFINAADLDGAGRPVTLTIRDVIIHTFQGTRGHERKPVVQFDRTHKELALNARNQAVLKAALGSDTDFWIGRRITIAARDDKFQGKVVRAIYVEAIGGQPQGLLTGQSHVDRLAAAGINFRPSMPQAARAESTNGVQGPMVVEREATDNIPF